MLFVAVFDIEIDEEDRESDEARQRRRFEDEREGGQEHRRVHRMTDEGVWPGRDEEALLRDIGTDIPAAPAHDEESRQSQGGSAEEKQECQRGGKAERARENEIQERRELDEDEKK